MHIAISPFQYQQLAQAAAIVRRENVRQRQWSSYTHPLPRNRWRGSSSYGNLRAIRATHGVGRPPQKGSARWLEFRAEGSPHGLTVDKLRQVMGIGA